MTSKTQIFQNCQHSPLISNIKEENFKHQKHHNFKKWQHFPFISTVKEDNFKHQKHHNFKKWQHSPLISIIKEENFKQRQRRATPHPSTLMCSKSPPTLHALIKARCSKKHINITIICHANQYKFQTIPCRQHMVAEHSQLHLHKPSPKP